MSKEQQKKSKLKILIIKLVFLTMLGALSISGLVACGRIAWENHTVDVTFNLMLPSLANTELPTGSEENPVNPLTDRLVRTPVTVMFTEYTEFPASHPLAGEYQRTPLLFLHGTEAGPREMNILDDLGIRNYNLAGYYHSVRTILPADDAPDYEKYVVSHFVAGEPVFIYAWHPLYEWVTGEDGVERIEYERDENNRIVREQRRLLNVTHEFPEWRLDDEGNEMWLVCDETGGAVYDYDSAGNPIFVYDEDGNPVYEDDENGVPQRVRRRLGVPNKIMGQNENGDLVRVPLVDRPTVYPGMQIFVRFEPEFTFEIGYVVDTEVEGNIVSEFRSVLSIRKPRDGYFRPMSLTGTFLDERSHDGISNITTHLNQIRLTEFFDEDGNPVAEDDEDVHRSRTRTLVMFRDAERDREDPLFGQLRYPRLPEQFPTQWNPNNPGEFDISYIRDGGPIGLAGVVVDGRLTHETWIQHKQDRTRPEGFNHRIYSSWLEGEWTIVTQAPRLSDALGDAGAGGIFLLGNLDFSPVGVNWPLHNTFFSGTFQGNGHTVSNVTRTITPADFAQNPPTNIAALFSTLMPSARIHNVSFENIMMNYNSHLPHPGGLMKNVALLAAQIHSGAAFSGVTISGEINLLQYALDLNPISMAALWGGVTGNIRLGRVAAFSPTSQIAPLTGINYSNIRITHRLYWPDSREERLNITHGSFSCAIRDNTLIENWNFERVENLISSLPSNITVANRAAVEVARAAFVALSEQTQRTVSNQAVLENAGLTIVQSLINALPAFANITVAHRAMVEDARGAFNTLISEETRVLVVGQDALNAAIVRSAYLLIEGLPAPASITLTNLVASRTSVATAREFFETLTPAQQALVGNLNTLVAAEARIVELTP
ncbi:MAG: hypothetical protein FWE22_07155 [Firmicutes bacterium]|nr:hypothetical protein [Bacillota bacterium]